MHRVVRVVILSSERAERSLLHPRDGIAKRSPIGTAGVVDCWWWIPFRLLRVQSEGYWGIVKGFVPWEMTAEQATVHSLAQRHTAQCADSNHRLACVS